MNIVFVILGFLGQNQMSGYDIKRKIEVSVSNFFDASYGAIYPALRRMEKDGLIEKKVIHQEGKPSKNLFAITQKGKESFREYLNSPLQPSVIRSDLLIRIFFGRFASKDQLINWIVEERKHVEQRLHDLIHISDAHPQLNPFEKMTLDYGVENCQHVLNSLEKQLKRLQELEEL